MSSENNDAKIIWFGSVVLILQPFLETQSFTNLLNLCKLFTAGMAVHKFSYCFICMDQWAWKLTMTVFWEINDHRSKTTQPISIILVSFFSEDNVLSDEIKIGYILKYQSKKNWAFHFFWDTRYRWSIWFPAILTKHVTGNIHYWSSAMHVFHNRSHANFATICYDARLLLSPIHLHCVNPFRTKTPKYLFQGAINLYCIIKLAT